MKLAHPYREGGSFRLKGSLHAHSTNSDGGQPPVEVFRHYESLGYDFVALTDHKTFPKREDLVLPPDSKLIAIPGNEYRGAGNTPEIAVIGVWGSLPNGLNVEAAMKAARESGGFTVYHHPNWHFDHWPTKQMLGFRAAHAVEIYNAIVEGMQGAAEATNKWDVLLTCGYRIWGTASDDAHQADHRGYGWVMVDAEKKEDSIVEALKAGRFYATTGVMIDEISVRNGVLTIRSPDAEHIRLYVERGTGRVDVPGNSVSYQIREDDVYVRAELYGRGVRKAWTNPVFVESSLSQQLSEGFASWYAGQPFT